MPNSQHNQSDHWLAASDISTEVEAQLREQIAEDRMLFDVVSGILEETGAVSVTGTQIAQILGKSRFTGAGDLGGFDRAPTRPARGRPRRPTEPIVVQGADAIAARLAERPSGLPPIAAEFGSEGKGGQWLRDGWANPEPQFTWSSAGTCNLELPKPIGGEDYLLRLVAGPFTAKERVPLQRITVAANEIILGTATISERSLIEWELPAAVLGGRSITRYTFSLPDAAKPCDVTGIADDRLLGFALERIELLRIGEQKLRDRTLAVIQGKAAIERYLGKRAQQRAVFRFGFGDTADRMLLLKHGWALPEARFTWTSARVSQCETTRPIPVENYRMRVTAGPFVRKELWPSQRLVISVNGFQLATTAVNDRAIIECPLPTAALKRGEVTSFTFAVPDAIRPRSIGASEDDRLLGFAIESIELFRQDPTGATLQPQVGRVAGAPVDVRTVTPTTLERGEQAGAAAGPAAKPVPANQFEAAPATGTRDSLQTPSTEPPTNEGEAREASMADPELQPNELMMRFESLGENCEFGLVQRRCGAEPLGLFRFSSAPLAKLLAALEARFEGFGAPEKIAVELSSNGREYMVRDGRYGFLYHAWVLADEMEPDEIRHREARRLPLLIRKLVEDLTVGQKLLVVRGMDEPLEPDQVTRLLSMLRRYGPNTLLWVALADRDHPAGFVEWAGPNLLKGYIDRFAPGDNAHDLSLECWITICREADRLRRRASEVGSATAAE